MKKRRAKKAYRKVMRGECFSRAECKAAFGYAVRYGGPMDPLVVRMSTSLRDAMMPFVRAVEGISRRLAPLIAKARLLR